MKKCSKNQISPISFDRWFVDNNIVTSNHGTELRLEKIGREMNNKIVKCEVNNAVGKSEETETMDINCESSPFSRFASPNFSLFLASSVCFLIGILIFRGLFAGVTTTMNACQL